MERRQAVLAALAEALFPALPAEAEAARQQGHEQLAALYELSGDAQPKILREVLDTAARHLTPDALRELQLVLDLLHSRWGTLLLAPRAALTLCFPFVRPFASLPVSKREGVLRAWATSRLPPLRKAFKAIKALTLSALFTSRDADGRSVIWDAIGYPGPDPRRPAQPIPAKQASERQLLRGTLDAAQALAAGGLPRLRAELGGLGLRTSQADAGGPGAVSLECDAVVVGSGAGGGVAAAQLARAGLRVLVLEKGTYTRAQDLSLLEKEAFDVMYERGGLLCTEDGAVSVLAGATLGGGTRINWNASFRTPDHVRREWALLHGCSAFASQRYDEALDAVCARLGVAEGKQDNALNAHLRQGLEALGVACGTIPRNCPESSACGHCCFGCATGAKQDSSHAWLPDAVAAGARILTGVTAQRVLLAPATEQQACSHSLLRPQAALTGAQHAAAAGRRQQAVGMVARVGDQQLVVHAPLVVVCAGAVHSPALLLRSGLTVNGNVGAHLHLHPATVVAAAFPQLPGTGRPVPGSTAAAHGPVTASCSRTKASERAADIISSTHSLASPGEGKGTGSVRMWEGAMMTAFSRAHANWDGDGYGPLVATPSVHPGLFAAACPWESAAGFKRFASQFSNIAVALTIVRDRHAGRVSIDRAGQPRLHYWPSPADQKSILQGMKLGLRALLAAGATTVSTLHPGPHAAFAAGGDFERYWQGILAQGIKQNGMTLLSAHQMSTCRMGDSELNSVVDDSGECWHAAGLFIADASAFPTATGVNPMVTVEAVAFMVAQGIVQSHSHLALQTAHTAPLAYETDP